jgi:hypothetical protein
VPAKMGQGLNPSTLACYGKVSAKATFVHQHATHGTLGAQSLAGMGRKVHRCDEVVIDQSRGKAGRGPTNTAVGSAGNMHRGGAVVCFKRLWR